MLHPKLVRTLKDVQKRLLNDGKLPTLTKLQSYYATFRERFGPDVLGNLDGEVLLTTMHALDRTNRNTLAYWLEFKNDEEFPFIFGSISGGSALKFGVYPNAKTGAWMSRDEGNFPVEISLNNAIEIARRHRDQLLRGVALLEALPLNAADTDYQALQNAMDAQSPDVSKGGWGHKYFSLLFPEKLDDYHTTYYQRFYLVKLLQPNIPEERAGRYIAAGRFVEVARELEMPMNHLTTVLNHHFGRPVRFWSILASDLADPTALNWDTQRNGKFAAISWQALDDLSDFQNTAASKKALNALIDQMYPIANHLNKQGVFNFVTEIKANDVVVAFDLAGRRVVGVGKVLGDYYYEFDEPKHRRAADWVTTEQWRFPVDEGFETAGREIRNYANQVEIERHILEALPDPSSGIKADVNQSQSKALRLTGVSGRIQTILERKGQAILYGPPGTGKTYWAEASACELAARQAYGLEYVELTDEQRQQVFGRPDSYVQFCSFHPAYGYEDFLEGYRPQLLNGQMTFVRQNGIFKQICGLARDNPKHNYYLIIDEINRGDIPRIFGELLTILEADKRGKTILLPVSGEGFAVPQNVFVIGTMNTADRSIALLDTALRRRFGFVELLPDPTQLGDVIIEGIPLGAWLEELNNRIVQYVGRDARNLQIGHAYLLENGKPLTDFALFARVIREDIIPLLEEYCYEDYSALKKILGATLVDEQNQIVRQELFDSGRERDLLQALLEPTPDLTTLSSVTEAEGEEATEEDNGLSVEKDA